MAQDDKTDLVERLEDSNSSPNLFMAAAARILALIPSSSPTDQKENLND